MEELSRIDLDILQQIFVQFIVNVYELQKTESKAVVKSKHDHRVDPLKSW